MPQKIDYNSISQEYNNRYAVSPLPGIRAYLIKLLEEHKPGSILEIACGTGHWLSELSIDNSNLYGLDLSIGMLKEAKNLQPAIRFVNADSGNIPFKDNQFDMIFCVNAIHFFQSAADVINKCKRLLKKNGFLSIIGYDPRNPETEWEVYKYFEGTYETDLKRYPLFEDLNKEMKQSSFKNIEFEQVDNVHSEKINDEILLDPFLRHKGCSQLAALSTEDYQKGINKIKTDVEKHRNEKRDLIMSKKLFFFSITGFKS
jgi:ubiquinone/menaquinone biosynthesis C-methylase UbiE